MMGAVFLFLLAVSCVALTPQQAAAKLVCLPQPDPALQETQADLTRAALVAPAYFANFRENPPKICIDDNMLVPRGAYEPGVHRITLNADLGRAHRLVVTLHEIRHLNQFSAGLCPSPQMSREAYTQAVLALEADAMANTLAVAWRLHAAGQASAWEAAQTLPRYQDIAARFAEEIATDGSIASAMAAAFAQWYRSDWRVGVYRIGACMAQLDRQDATNLLPLYAPLPQDFLSRLCQLPDGTPYACVPMPE
jgi:hypothetical protein